jgi:hypothetical protein
MKTNAIDHPQFISFSAPPLIARGLRIVTVSAPLSPPAGHPHASISALFIEIEFRPAPPTLPFFTEFPVHRFGD